MPFYGLSVYLNMFINNILAERTKCFIWDIYRLKIVSFRAKGIQKKYTKFNKLL